MPTMSKTPISASRLAEVVSGMPWSCAAGMKWVPMSPLVDHPQIQNVRNSAQKTQVRLASRKDLDARRAAAPGPERVDGRLDVRRRRAVGHLTHVGGPVSQDQQDDGDQQQGEDGDHAGAHRHPGPCAELGDQRQEDQLARRARRGEDAGDQAAVAHEPPVGHDRPEHQRHGAGPHPDRTPHRNHSCQASVITRVRPDPSDTSARAAASHPSYAEALHQSRGERGREPVEDQVEARCTGSDAPRPAELVLERLEEGAGGRSEPGGGHQGRHRHRGHPPRPRAGADAAHRGLGHPPILGSGPIAGHAVAAPLRRDPANSELARPGTRA